MLLGGGGFFGFVPWTFRHNWPLTLLEVGHLHRVFLRAGARRSRGGRGSKEHRGEMKATHRGLVGGGGRGLWGVRVRSWQRYSYNCRALSSHVAYWHKQGYFNAWGYSLIAVITSAQSRARGDDTLTESTPLSKHSMSDVISKTSC